MSAALDLIDFLEDHSSVIRVSESSPANFRIRFDVCSLTDEEFGRFYSLVADDDAFNGEFVLSDVDGFISFSGGRFDQQCEDDDVAELDLSFNWRPTLSEFRFYEGDDDAEASSRLYEFAQNLTDRSLTVSMLVDKENVEQAIREDLPEVASDQFEIHFWRSESDLNGWLDSQSLTDVISHFFEYDRPPLLVLWSENHSRADPCIVASGDSLGNLSLQNLDDASESYKTYMRRCRGVTWHDSLPYLHPKHVRGLQQTLSSPVWSRALAYATLAMFSSSVEQSDGKIVFTVSEDDGVRVEEGVERLHDEWGRDGVDAVWDLYNRFSDDEDVTAFKDIWQRAIAENCGDGFTDLPNRVEDVRKSCETLEQTAIKANFDDLSNVIEDTQSLLANLNARLSDAATETSKQMQTLGFTLVATIVANLFLVLRWSNAELLLPFSIFVVTVLVSVHLPLVQARISDLESVIDEAEKDYQLYESTIKRFGEKLFPFEKLRERKNAYTGLARKQRRRSQQRLNTVFLALLVVWGGLALVSAVLFPLVSFRFLPVILSLIILLAISQDASSYEEDDGETESIEGTLRTLHRNCSHASHKYFDERFSLGLARFLGLLVVGKILFLPFPFGLLLFVGVIIALRLTDVVHLFGRVASEETDS